MPTLLIRLQVYIVTGANTGVGKELAQILYAKHAKVYVAARSEEKAKAAIESIKASSPDSKGALALLHLDLADLTTIKKSATDFLSQETKVHVLFNNAGVMTPPQGSKSAQGYELQLGVNNLGTFLFTKLLTPALASTARDEPPGTVRVVWVSSSAAEHFSHTPGGVDLENLTYEKQDLSAATKYGTSKAGNYLHATEFARRHRDDGIISVSLNPGNLNTELARHRTAFEKWFLQTVVQYPPIMGAYTELFAGLSPLVTAEKSGDWSEFWFLSPPQASEGTTP